MSGDAEALKIIEEALDIEDAGARAAFIAAACGADAALRARVEQLLAFEQSGRTILPTTSFLRPMGVIEAIPDRIGPFVVEAEIARSGMGAVVKARRDDGRFDQQVAIKLIRGDLASLRARERFAAERRILGRLRHPSIVRILDGGEIEGRPWLAMEFIDGLPVDEALEAADASREARLEAFAAVAEAVAYAHRQLVIHADIKPSNVLMDRDGQVHLLDFGISRLVAGMDVDETGDPYPLTRGFAAPERGVGVVPTVASDVYSLGVLLLAMLGHKVPSGEEAMVPGTRLPASLLDGLLDGDLAAIAARALAELPEARYPDAAALASDIHRHLASLPVSVREHEGWRYISGRFIRRHRRGLALTTIILVALLATSIGASVQYWRAEAARSEADARFADARGVANYLLFTLIPALENTPRSLEVREAAAAEAERYLTRLAAARQADDELRLETAQGLAQLAMLQGRTGRPNLGQPESAAANLARAAGIAERLEGRDALELLGRIRIEQGRLAMWFNADLEAAARFMKRASAALARLQPANPRLALDLTLVESELAGFKGDFPRQQRLAEAALAEYSQGATGLAAIDRAKLISLVAEAIYYQERPAEALALYREGLAIIEAEQAARPGGAFLLDRLAKAQWEVGTTLTELRQYHEAIRRLALAEQLAQEAAAFEPASRDARRLVAGMRASHAQALGLSGQTEAALTLLRANIAAQRAVLEAEPTGLAARDYAYAYTLIGETLTAAGRRAEACVADREALARYASLRKRGLINAFDEGGNVSVLERRIAANCS
jgi:tRNA A-37 threonylcarbamoyl transferase component Bud32